MKHEQATATFDELELLVGYKWKDHFEQLEENYSEHWLEIEIESAECVVFGRGYDILPMMPKKDVDRLHSLVREKHGSLLNSLDKVMSHRID